MALKDFGELNAMQLDALREIGNIGSGNAASALSSMLSRPVDIQVPKINVLNYDIVVENLGGAENPLVGLLLSLEGDITGMIMFLLDQKFANMVLSELLGETIDGGEFDEMSRSAMMEVGNIMAASYINAIAMLTNLKINISVPSICVDMAGSIVSVPAIYYSDISDKIIFIEDEFNPDSDHASSHVLLFPEVDSLQKIMSSLGLDE